VTKTTSPAVEGEVIEADEAPANAVVVSEAAPTALPEKRLKAIATSIRREFGKGIDSQFAIGHLLNEARALNPGDREFGQWYKEQGFMFSQPTASRLMAAANREPEVREFIAAHSETNGRDISVNYAIEKLNAGTKPDSDDELQAMGKRVRDLIAEDEAEPHSPYPAFQKALANLNLQVLTVEELTSLAGDIQALAVAYKAEKARRSE